MNLHSGYSLGTPTYAATPTKRTRFPGVPHSKVLNCGGWRGLAWHQNRLNENACRKLLHQTWRHRTVRKEAHESSKLVRCYSPAGLRTRADLSALLQKTNKTGQILISTTQYGAALLFIIPSFSLATALSRMLPPTGTLVEAPNVALVFLGKVVDTGMAAGQIQLAHGFML